MKDLRIRQHTATSNAEEKARKIYSALSHIEKLKVETTEMAEAMKVKNKKITDLYNSHTNITETSQGKVQKSITFISDCESQSRLVQGKLKLELKLHASKIQLEKERSMQKNVTDLFTSGSKKFQTLVTTQREKVIASSA